MPSEYYERYPLDRIDLPRILAEDAGLHPVVAGIRRFMNYDLSFDDHARLVARAAYYGLCTFTDALVRRVIAALDAAGRRDDRLLVYTSNHGEGEDRPVDEQGATEHTDGWAGLWRQPKSVELRCVVRRMTATRGLRKHGRRQGNHFIGRDSRLQHR